ncbi:hypothetical protein SEVIR_5G409801v4 [Setaria viridis]
MEVCGAELGGFQGAGDNMCFDDDGRPPQALRDDVDGERAHHHGGDRLRGAVAGVGHCAARLGGRPRLYAALLARHLLHLRAPCRLQPLRRTIHWQAQLHLHGTSTPTSVRARSPVFVEKWAARWWPESAYVTGEVEVPLPLPLLQGTRRCRVNPFRATWRTAFVVATTVASMLLPFFNGAVGFLGALGFWPLTVYFPVEMYVVQKKVPRWSTRWVCLQMLSLGCLVISVAAATGSIAGIASDLKVYRPFKSY